MNKLFGSPSDVNGLSSGPKSPGLSKEWGVSIEPMDGVSAQALASDSCSHCGWVKKEGNGTKNWKRRYMVIHKGCIYYFSDAQSDSPKGCFTLQGYRVLQAHDRPRYQWSLKLVNVDPIKRTYYIAADSEPELKIWLIKTREEVEKYFGSGSADSTGSNEEKSPVDGPSHTIEDYDYPDFIPRGPPSMPLPCTPNELAFGRSISLTSPSSRPRMKNRSLTDPEGDFPPLPPPRDSQPDYETPRFELPMSDRPLPPKPKSSQSKPPQPKPRVVNSPIEVEEGAPVLPPKPHNARPRPNSCASDTTFVLPGGKSKDDSVKNAISCTETEAKTLPRVAVKPKPPPRPNSKSPYHDLKIPANWSTKQSAIPGMHIESSDIHKLKSMLRTKPPKKKAEPMEIEGDNDSDPEHYLEFEPDSYPGQNKSKRVDKEKRPLSHEMSELYVIDSMLPESAIREDLDKTQAGQLLLAKGIEGLYMMCSSKSAVTKQALSVFVDNDKHKTYIIFKDENGYHLDPSEPVRCRNIDELIKYYRKSSLPRTKTTLTKPYQD